MPVDAHLERIERIVLHLTDARLLTVSQDAQGDRSVALAHELLILAWPRLRAWIEEERQALHFRSQLTEAAYEWQSAESNSSYLYRGARLAEAVEWARYYAYDMTVLEREFLEASQRAQRYKRLRLLLVGLLFTLDLVVAVGRNSFVRESRLRSIGGYRWMEQINEMGRHS